MLDDSRVAFTDPSGRGIIVLDERTGESVFHETPTLEIHAIHADPRAPGVLWLADPGAKALPELGYEAEQRPGQVLRFDLADGSASPLIPPGNRAAPLWRPTSIAISSDALWVADGYGQSLVHRYGDDGEPGLTLDGSSSGTEFSCPHGIAVDARGAAELIVIADRGNSRLVFTTPDGTFVRTVRDHLIRTPSSVAVRGDDLVVVELDGALLAVDPDDHVRALVDGPRDTSSPGWPNRQGEAGLERPELTEGVLNSPHAVAVAPDGDLYVAEWLIGGRVTRLRPI